MVWNQLHETGLGKCKVLISANKAEKIWAQLGGYKIRETMKVNY